MAGAPGLLTQAPAFEHADLEQLLAVAPVEIRERLARRFLSASALRACRLDERDAAYRDLAADSAETSGYAIQKAVRAEVERYRRGAWRFDRGRAPPTDPRPAIAWQILTLDGGQVRSRSTVEQALARVCSNSGPQMNGQLPHAPSPEQSRGRDEGAANSCR